MQAYAIAIVCRRVRAFVRVCVRTYETRGMASDCNVCCVFDVVVTQCDDDAARYLERARSLLRPRPPAHIASVCVGARHFPGLRGSRV